MRRGGRHSPWGLWEDMRVGGSSDKSGRAGVTSITTTWLGSYDCGLLQLKPALHAVQGTFLPGSGLPPDPLHAVTGAAFPGQQSPAMTT
jgi:hypothetical protein